MRPSLHWLALPALLALAGCTHLGDRSGRSRSPPPPAVQPSEAELVASHLELMRRLVMGSSAAQAELDEAVRVAFLADPSTPNRLRYGLVLATPGHGASDPAGARRLLGEVLATPERLLPAEQALAEVAYRDVDARLALTAEIRQLRTAAEEAPDSQQAEVAQRRLQAQLQAQMTENVRLKRELDAALAKLEAVATLEKSLLERQASPPRNP